MRDYFCTDTGKSVAEMTTTEIDLQLKHAATINPVGADVTREAIVERLMLELFIRANNLRAGL